MKTLIIADTHGNITNLRHVVAFGKKINVEAIIHCGDWDNIASVETILSFGIPLYSVLGNADIDPNLEKLLEAKCKKFDRKSLKFELGGRSIMIIHNIRDLEPGILKLDIIFFGHWQKQQGIFWKEVKAVNPGGLENEINFVIYDTATNEVKFIRDD